MATYVFRASYLVEAKSRPIIIEAECLEDAEEECSTMLCEARTFDMVDPSSVRTIFHEFAGIHAC